MEAPDETVTLGPWAAARLAWERWLDAVMRDPEQYEPATKEAHRAYRVALEHARTVAPRGSP